MRPIHFAAEKGSLPTVKFLVKKGAKVDVRSAEGLRPVEYAINGKHLKIADYLRQKMGEGKKKRAKKRRQKRRKRRSEKRVE